VKVGDLVRLLPSPAPGAWRASAQLAGKSGLLVRRVADGYKDGLPVFVIHRQVFEGQYNPTYWWVLLNGKEYKLREAGLETISAGR
jgi:hypothetical protein